MSEEHQRLTREEWINKIRTEGKDTTIRGEMIRLGFWEEKSISDEERQQQQLEDEEYQQLNKELQVVKKQAKKLKNVDKLLKEARQRRIEASRQRRSEQKTEREKAQLEAKERWKEFQKTHVIHAGIGVSAGLSSFEYDELKLMQNQLPLIRSSIQLAEELEITMSKLKWLTYHRDTATINHYTQFTIPKKSGGIREIAAPKPELRKAQNWIKDNILAKLPVHSAAFGFVSGRSTVDNARNHVGKAVVIKLDLKDFFPSISFARVKGLFQSFGYSPAISSLFSLICTEPPRKEVQFSEKIYHIAMSKRQLPQGACTSPSITNLICRRLDEKLSNLAEANGFRYSRYADDLTFSGEKKIMDKIGSIIHGVRGIVQYEGFSINEKKTRILRAAHRQRVTGIVVNQFPNLTREELRKFRALLHNVEQNGLQVENRSQHPDFWAYINGFASYIKMVRPDLGVKFAAQIKRIGEKYALRPHTNVYS